MLKQKLFVLGVAAMVLMIVGCSDDSTSSSSNTVCKVGQKECTEDGKERVCEATGWVTYDCPEGQTCAFVRSRSPAAGLMINRWVIFSASFCCR